MIMFEASVVHGELWCMRCLAKTWFVSWEDSHTGPEHAECRECGFTYGWVDERVTDERGVITLRRRSLIDPAVYAAARKKMQDDFAREIVDIDIARGLAIGTTQQGIAKAAADRTAEIARRLHGPNAAKR